MKTMSKLILSAAGVLLALAASGFAQGGWVVVPTPTTANLMDVDFVDAGHGTIVGAARTILHTTTGGATWVLPTIQPGSQLNAVSFTNDSVGVAVGLDGQILLSQNGGAAWSVIQDGYLVTYWGAHQVTPAFGIAMGQNTIFQPFGTWSSNTWQTMESFSFYVQHDQSGNEGAVRDVFFFNPTEGCAAVAVWDGHGAVVKTTDNGTTWTTQLWTNGALYAIDFPSPTVGFACGQGGILARTTDAGVSWQDLGSITGQDLWDVKFVNPDTGWMVGTGGRILRTNDGGTSNHVQNSGVTVGLRGVDFATADTGYVVGDSGVVLRTFTGGEGPSATPEAPAARVAEYSMRAFPNPFNPSTTIAFTLPQAAEAVLRVFDVEGRTVLEHRFGALAAGEHRVEFDGSRLPSGIYLSRLETPRGMANGKLVLLK